MSMLQSYPPHPPSALLCQVSFISSLASFHVFSLHHENWSHLCVFYHSHLNHPSVCDHGDRAEWSFVLQFATNLWKRVQVIRCCKGFLWWEKKGFFYLFNQTFSYIYNVLFIYVANVQIEHIYFLQLKLAF